MSSPNTDALTGALLASVPGLPLRTEQVPLPRALNRVYAGAGVLEIATGEPLQALQIAAIAATGAARVEVYPRPTVAVFSFGDALLHAGASPVPGAQFDAASPMLQALLSGLDIESLAWPALPQTPARIEAALGDAVDSFDLVLITATAEAAASLLQCLPRLGIGLPAAAMGGPRGWRSSRARLLWLDSEPAQLQLQFEHWVRPLIAALQYAKPVTA
ncbi:hypothetical protein [Aquimonas sp.]|jgi:molybdopterin molybdotransferase|uniref:hypothetical protein n=1 Tax=Aquimonas sp. TaxID=1872588 RepID=UPI0037C04E6C